MGKICMYEQFGIKVVDFLDKDIIACWTKETGTLLLYKSKPENKYVWCKEFTRLYLGKYKIVYYEPNKDVEGIILSTICF